MAQTPQKPQTPRAAPAPKPNGQPGLAKQTQEQQRAIELSKLIEAKRGSFAAVAAKHFDVDRLVKLAQSALSRKPKLATCTATSMLLCLVRCAELGLEPDSAIATKRMWLVPRWNSKIKANEATFIIDYRAQLQLARESGLVSSIDATEICEKDKRSAMRFSSDGESIRKFDIEIDPFTDRGPVIGYLAAARFKSGETQAVPFSRKQAEFHMNRYGPKYDGKITGPWASEFDQMALKTTLRKLFNLLPAGETEQGQKLQRAAAQEVALEGGAALRPSQSEKLLLGDVPGEEQSTADEVADALAAASDLAEQVEERQEEAGEQASETQEGADEPGSRG